jgi:hypothetical protein
MFPTHPDMLGVSSTLDWEDRLHVAANERIAASAQAGERSPRTMPKTGSRFMATWLGGMRRRWRGAERAEAAAPVAQRHVEVPSVGKA